MADSLDLLGVALLAVAGTFSLAVGGQVPSPIRVALGVVFVLFAPGYALVSLLIPRRTVSGEGGERPVTVPQRLLLSVGLSVVIVPLVGLAMNYTRWGVTPESTVVALGVVTFLLAELAVGSRLAADPDRRFRGDPTAAAGRLRDRLAADRSRETAINVAIAAGLVVALAGVGLAVATTDSGERYTEFYLLSENETGEPVADGYPSNLTVGEPTDLHVGIANEEGETVDYTVVVQLQRVERDGERATVAERFDVDSFTVTLADGETVERRHTVVPAVAGEEFRLSYLLYVGEPPANPSQASASRSVHLWVEVDPADG